MEKSILFQFSNKTAFSVILLELTEVSIVIFIVKVEVDKSQAQPPGTSGFHVQDMRFYLFFYSYSS